MTMTKTPADVGQSFKMTDANLRDIATKTLAALHSSTANVGTAIVAHMQFSAERNGSHLDRFANFVNAVAAMPRGAGIAKDIRMYVTSGLFPIRAKVAPDGRVNFTLSKAAKPALWLAGFERAENVTFSDFVRANRPPAAPRPPMSAAVMASRLDALKEAARKANLPAAVIDALDAAEKAVTAAIPPADAKEAPAPKPVKLPPLRIISSRAA